MKQHRMQFTIEPAIFERFPGIRIAVAIAQGDT
jgi:hypothetical protein